MAVTPSLQNDIRRIPGNLLLVDRMHIGVAGLQGFAGKVVIAECTGDNGETIALALVEEALNALIDGLQQAREQMGSE